MELEAMNEIPSGVGVFDATPSVIIMKYLNDGFYRMIGARREDRTRFFNEGTINSVHPDDRAGLISEAHASIREKRLFEYHFRNLDGKGEYVWIGIRASHKPVDEKTERFYASYYNVDQFVNEREELAAYGKRLDSILGSIPGGVAMFYEQNGEIRLAYSNAGFYALHHGSEEYWSKQSRNPVDWLTAEDRHIFRDEFRSVVQKKKKMGSVIYRVIGEDGKLHWISNQFCPAECLDGVQYYYASFIDMDKQLAAEQELMRDKQMYDDAAKSAKLFIWSYDINTHRASMMQGGYTQEAVQKIGLPQVIENLPDSLLPYIAQEDRDAFAEAYHSINAGAAYASCEFRYRTPQMETQQYERIILRRITDQDGSKLGRWIERQRAALHGKGTYTISADQIQLLDKIGMMWCLGERQDWDFWYAMAEEYYKTHGNLLISKKCSSEGHALGNWIGEQRRQYQDGRLKKERRMKLEAISMEWSVRERRSWEEWYLDAIFYKREHGNIDIPFQYKTKDGHALGSWLERQRENYWMTGKRFQQGEGSPLTEDRIMLLERLGMKWTSRKWKAEEEIPDGTVGHSKKKIVC
jgi:PAS domain-containing protein